MIVFSLLLSLVSAQADFCASIAVNGSTPCSDCVVNGCTFCYLFGTNSAEIEPVEVSCQNSTTGCGFTQSAASSEDRCLYDLANACSSSSTCQDCLSSSYSCSWCPDGFYGSCSSSCTLASVTDYSQCDATASSAPSSTPASSNGNCTGLSCTDCLALSSECSYCGLQGFYTHCVAGVNACSFGSTDTITSCPTPAPPPVANTCTGLSCSDCVGKASTCAYCDYIGVHSDCAEGTSCIGFGPANAIVQKTTCPTPAPPTPLPPGATVRATTTGTTRKNVVIPTTVAVVKPVTQPTPAGGTTSKSANATPTPASASSAVLAVSAIVVGFASMW